MIKFFRTWIDWWLFIPLSLAIAIGSYWAVPFVLSSLGMPEQDMQYTGTAWVYGLSKAACMFMFGIGVVSLSYRFYFPKIHRYLESDYFDIYAKDNPSLKFKTSLLIPAVLFIGWCLICLAAF